MQRLVSRLLQRSLATNRQFRLDRTISDATSSSKRDFDVVVIGAGPAGYAATMRAWDFGKRVCLVEKGRIGGTGISNGALSSKTMWELSRDYQNAIRKDRGFVAKSVCCS